jgi:hypothetical protein
MAYRNPPPPFLFQSTRQGLDSSTHCHEYKDTDPQMLFAIWDMEKGIDPDLSLDQIEGSVVVYDKFAPRLSRRK